ncbi:hypothetical protein [Kamptonema sp. UHCC 0994]|uniref:hypothetical protein n=1 Tax=Kamptonema sp. UHCC 0994 TaxID=3031329 RepID=UPI0023BA4B4B|nr:hypothetical protein [Kamptonema sp. UHCC 0994]MDF0556291.1 hypothetical protein [Kamptonema sp. UHCC 0994]
MNQPIEEVKPVGGRGKTAKYPTIMRRIPAGIKQCVECLSSLYRSEVWNGSVEGVTLKLVDGSNSSLELLGWHLIAVADSEQIGLSLPPQVRDELASIASVIRIAGEAKPDIEISESALKLHRQLQEANGEIERLKTQLKSSLHSPLSSPSSSSPLQVEHPNGIKPDIEYSNLEVSRQLKEAAASLKKQERQLKAQADQIQKLSSKANKYRQERDQYRAKLDEAEYNLERLGRDLEIAKSQVASTDAVSEQNAQLQQELAGLMKRVGFLTADAQYKAKMADILNNIIDDVGIPPGKLKSFVKIALVAGRGECGEQIDTALNYLKKALTVARASGNEWENKALELVGEKPRRAMRKKS